jgi:hypothetical protein
VLDDLHGEHQSGDSVRRLCFWSREHGTLHYHPTYPGGEGGLQLELPELGRSCPEAFERCSAQYLSRDIHRGDSSPICSGTKEGCIIVTHTCFLYHSMEEFMYIISNGGHGNHNL